MVWKHKGSRETFAQQWSDFCTHQNLSNSTNDSEFGFYFNFHFAGIWTQAPWSLGGCLILILLLLLMIIYQVTMENSIQCGFARVEETRPSDWYDIRKTHREDKMTYAEIRWDKINSEPRRNIKTHQPMPRNMKKYWCQKRVYSNSQWKSMNLISVKTILKCQCVSRIKTEQQEIQHAQTINRKHRPCGRTRAGSKWSSSESTFCGVTFHGAGLPSLKLTFRSWNWKDAINKKERHLPAINVQARTFSFRGEYLFQNKLPLKLPPRLRRL